MATLIRRRTIEDEDPGAFEGILERGQRSSVVDNIQKRLDPLLEPIQWVGGATMAIYGAGRAVYNAGERIISQFSNGSAQPTMTPAIQRPIYPTTTSKLPNTKTVVGPYSRLYNTSQYTKGPKGRFTGRR